MKKILVFVLVIVLAIIGWIIFNNWRNNPERFISQISAVSEFTTKTERARETTETEQIIRKEALKLFPDWWPKKEEQN